MNSTIALPGLNAVTLTQVLRHALNQPHFEVEEWHAASLHHNISNPATGGLYRFTGTGLDAGRIIPWSLVLKIAQLAGDAPEGWGTELLHFSYWEREALAYQSGLLQDLPGGLAAPRCFEATAQPDGSLWLWLEDIQENEVVPWPLSRFGIASRHFGQWQGIYLAGWPLPEFPWLQTGWLRSWTEHFAFLRDYVRRPEIWEHPLVRHAFPIPILERLLQLEAQHPLWMDILDHLPHTVCHFDVWRPNLLARRLASGQQQTVAVDWQSAGLGPAGETGNLVITSLMNLEIKAQDAKALDAMVWEGYLEGLREAGWRGDPRSIRFAYTAYPALRWGLVFPLLKILPFALNDSKRREAEAEFGQPIEALLEQWGNAFYFLLDLAEEARLLGAAL